MKYVRRFLWYIASRMMIFTVILSLLFLAFYLPMNAANIYILLDDGMRMRTEVILTREDAHALTNFFRDDFLYADEALNLGLSSDSPYAYYNITSFESKVSLEWVWSWPWEDTAQAIIAHTVPVINGSVLSTRKSLAERGAIGKSPPSWQGGRYRMTLLKENGQWKIAGITQTQVILEPTPAPAT